MREKNYREFACRLVILFIGLTIAHLGVTLFLLSNLGADPFNVLIQGLRQQIENAGWNLTHGTVHMAVSFLIILILLIVDRHYVKAGTLICMFCGGPIIDFFSWLLKSLNIGGASLPVKIPVLVLGCVILAFGMTIVIRSEAGTGPNDLVLPVLRRMRCSSWWAFSLGEKSASAPSSALFWWALWRTSSCRSQTRWCREP